MDAVVSKGNQRLHFLRKLRKFNVGENILNLFYRATIESVLTFNSLCYYNQITVANSDRLARIVKSAGIIIGAKVADLDELLVRKSLKRV